MWGGASWVIHEYVGLGLHLSSILFWPCEPRGLLWLSFLICEINLAVMVPLDAHCAGRDNVCMQFGVMPGPHTF